MGSRVVLVAAIFLCPVVVDPGTADPFNLVKVTVLWTLALSALGLWTIDRIRSWEPPRGAKLGYLALVVLAINALATIFSRNPALSLVGGYKRYAGFASLVLYVIVLWLIIDLYREHEHRLREILVAVSWASGIVSVYAILQGFDLDPIAWQRAAGASLANSISLMGNSQFAGDFVGIAAPALAFLFFERVEDDAGGRRRAAALWTRRLAAAGLVLSVPALYFTQSRSGILAAVVGVGALALFNRDRVPGWVKVGVVGALLAGAALGVVVLLHPGMERPPAPLDDMRILRSDTVGYRYYWWQAGAEMVLDNPILGTGPETFSENLPTYRTRAEGADLGLQLSDKPHNVYLEHGVSAGILGLAAYVALVGAGLVWARRRAKRAEPAARLLLGAFTGILAGYLVQGFFSIDVPPLALMGWVALGGIGAMADPDVLAERESEGSDGAQRPPRIGGVGKTLAYVGVGILVLALVLVGARPLRADQALKAAQRLDARDAPPSRVFPHYVRAIRIHPYEVTFRALAGDYFADVAEESSAPEEKVRFHERALELYQQAHELQPGNVVYMAKIGNTHMEIARLGETQHWAEAARWWERITEEDRFDWEAHGRYAQVLIGWAEAAERPEIYCRAVSELETAGELHPQEVDIWSGLAEIHITLRQLEDALRAIERAQEVDPGNDDVRRMVNSLEGLTVTGELHDCDAG